jgi:hypothetical protein
MSYGLPETVVNELVEHHTPITYPKGSMIFLQGAPTDIIYWVSSGLVDILCPDVKHGASPYQAVSYPESGSLFENPFKSAPTRRV